MAIETILVLIGIFAIVYYLEKMYEIKRDERNDRLEKEMREEHPELYLEEEWQQEQEEKNKSKSKREKDNLDDIS